MSNNAICTHFWYAKSIICFWIRRFHERSDSKEGREQHDDQAGSTIRRVPYWKEEWQLLCRVHNRGPSKNQPNGSPKRDEKIYRRLKNAGFLKWNLTAILDCVTKQWSTGLGKCKPRSRSNASREWRKWHKKWKKNAISHDYYESSGSSRSRRSHLSNLMMVRGVLEEPLSTKLHQRRGWRPRGASSEKQLLSKTIGWQYLPTGWNVSDLPWKSGEARLETRQPVSNSDESQPVWFYGDAVSVNGFIIAFKLACHRNYLQEGAPMRLASHFATIWLLSYAMKQTASAALTERLTLKSKSHGENPKRRLTSSVQSGCDSPSGKLHYWLPNCGRAQRHSLLQENSVFVTSTGGWRILDDDATRWTCIWRVYIEWEVNRGNSDLNPALYARLLEELRECAATVAGVYSGLLDPKCSNFWTASSFNACNKIEEVETRRVN